MKKTASLVTTLILILSSMLLCMSSAGASMWYCTSCGSLADGSRCYYCQSYTNYSAIGTGTVHGLSSGKSLLLRYGPGTGYDTIGRMYNGDMVTVFSVKNGYAEIDYHGTHGFATASYINVSYDIYVSPPSSSYGSYTWGRCNQRLSTRTGPGTDYDGPGTTVEYPSYSGKQVKVISAAWDSRNSIWWLQVQVEKNGNLRRVYTGLKRIDNVNVYSINTEDYVVSSYARITTSSYPYHGPGSYYERVSTYLYSGTTGRIISLEDGYAQFEYTSGGYKHRCWVPTSYVSW